MASLVWNCLRGPRRQIKTWLHQCKREKRKSLLSRWVYCSGFKENAMLDANCMQPGCCCFVIRSFSLNCFSSSLIKVWGREEEGEHHLSVYLPGCCKDRIDSPMCRTLSKLEEGQDTKHFHQSVQCHTKWQGFLGCNSIYCHVWEKRREHS